MHGISAGWCGVRHTVDDATPKHIWVAVNVFRMHADRKSNMQFTKALYVGEASVAKEAAPYNSNQQTHLRVRGAYGPDVSKVKPKSLFPLVPYTSSNLLLHWPLFAASTTETNTGLLQSR
jgi:hypothetical protein